MHKEERILVFFRQMVYQKMEFFSTFVI